MKNVVIITNAPAPYRVAFFDYIQKKESGYKFHIVYTSQNEDIGRQWHVSEEELGSHSFLECKVITIKRRYDDKRIVLSVGIAKRLKELKPDIVICMEYNVTILQAVHWCRRHHVPFLSWSDGTANSEHNISGLQRRFRKYVIERAVGFISSSTATMEHQISFGAKRELCHKSLLTVDIKKYLREKPEDYRPGKNLLYVGSLIGRKGLDLLMPALARTDAGIKLVIVGEGSEEAVLRAQIAELGLTERVTFKGFLEGEALAECYEKSDVFVIPTREDCYGLVILEAMCASLPVIASKYADGAFDIMEDGVHGRIVDPYETKELAKAIDDIFSDEDRLKRMQKASFQKAKEFGFPQVAEGFYEALDAVYGNLKGM
ncbi:MAG: glycosyltransferase family 4 protein [Roseburia sp.]|nr:glycosyltransferase family 4 protein [Roseburia sp.]